MKNPYTLKLYKSALILFILLPITVFSQESEKRAVYNAAMDYLEGMYQADAARIRKSVHPNVIKKGYYWKGKTQSFSDLTSISYEQLVQIASDWNREGWLPENAPKDITIFDVQEKIALVKVTAYWGVDYLQLTRSEDKWMITHILWQNWPKYLTEKQQGQ